MRLKEFENGDYEIHDRPKLDRILLELCHRVIQGKQNDPMKYGMVAACVLDPKNRKVFGVNEAAKDGTRRHAERVAIDRYVKHYGDIPEGSIIITTLSPCNEDDTEMADERYGESCTDLVNNSNVRKVYCGYIDPSQHEEHAEYTLEETDNNDIKTLCKKFADTFLKDELDESAAWHRKAGKSKTGGLNDRGIASYRREHPGSHLQKAVTTKPSKLKAGSKAAKRRKSFCARMSGVDGPMKKPNGKPTRKALALRKWNC
jgi:pyrimidine deaminase RibD-like protein